MYHLRLLLFATVDYRRTSAAQTNVVSLFNMRIACIYKRCPCSSLLHTILIFVDTLPSTTSTPLRQEIICPQNKRKYSGANVLNTMYPFLELIRHWARDLSLRSNISPQLHSF